MLLMLVTRRLQLAGTTVISSVSLSEEEITLENIEVDQTR